MIPWSSRNVVESAKILLQCPTNLLSRQELEQIRLSLETAALEQGARALHEKVGLNGKKVVLQ